MREASTVSASCFWMKSDKKNETGYSYPDRFHVTRDIHCEKSSRECLLDGTEEEKISSEYRLRCNLYQYCVERIDETVNETITMTTNHSMTLIKEFLQSVSVNYRSSHVLPICLALLDAESYKHSKRDLFQLEPFVTKQLQCQFIEIDEISGLRILQETMKGSSAVIYLTQSEFRKQDNIKDIVEYCVQCRMSEQKQISLIIEWYCFPEEFANLLQRSITANCIIQPILFPSTIQLLNDLFQRIIIDHILPFDIPLSYLTRINTTLVNYEYSIWSWIRSIKFCAWQLFSYQSSSVIAAIVIQKKVQEKKKDVSDENSEGEEKEEMAMTNNDKPDGSNTTDPTTSPSKTTPPQSIESSTKRKSTRKKRVYQRVEGRYNFRTSHSSSSSLPALPMNITSTIIHQKLDTIIKPIVQEIGSKSILHSHINQLLQIWSLQQAIVSMYSSFIHTYIGSLSSRELYMVIWGEGMNVSETHKRLRQNIGQIQDKARFVKDVEMLESVIKMNSEVLGDNTREFNRLITQITKELEEADKTRGRQMLSREAAKKGMGRDALKKQLLQQQEENSMIRMKTKEKLLIVVEKLVKETQSLLIASPVAAFLISNQTIPRSVLSLSNRRSVIQGIQYPQSYYKCDCCNDTVTVKSEDVTILYNAFKNVGKVTQVGDLKKEFYTVFEGVNGDEVEARFWDSLTTLQYLGFLVLSENDEKVTKLDFAL